MKSIIVKSISNDEYKIKLKDIREISFNFVNIRFTYKQWLKTGLFEVIELELSPESLRKLIDNIQLSKYKNITGLNTAYSFLEVIPTSEEYFKKLDYINNLPRDNVKMLK